MPDRPPDPWIDFFRQNGGKKYLGHLVCQGPDKRWYTRDLEPSLHARSIGTSATLADAKKAIEVVRGMHRPSREPKNS